MTRNQNPTLRNAAVLRKLLPNPVLLFDGAPIGVNVAILRYPNSIDLGAAPFVAMDSIQGRHGQEEEEDDNLCEEEVEHNPSDNHPIPESPNPPTSRRMEVPTHMVGLLIGKSGVTIHNLQQNSGAIIQMPIRADAHPGAATRTSVGLIGTLDNINKAENLINQVIMAAALRPDANVMEQIHLQVPYEKAGHIIGKGGKRIRDLQTRSGARMKFLSQYGDSTDRTLQVSGDKKQIHIAMGLVKEAMNQNVKRSTPPTRNQQGYRQSPEWGPQPAATIVNVSYSPHSQGIYNYGRPPLSPTIPPNQGYPQPYPALQIQPRNMALPAQRPYPATQARNIALPGQQHYPCGSFATATKDGYQGKPNPSSSLVSAANYDTLKLPHNRVSAHQSVAEQSRPHPAFALAPPSVVLKTKKEL